MTDLDPDLRPSFTPQAIRRGLRLNIAAGSLGMIWVAVALNVPFIMLLEALGASGTVLGVFTAVRQFAIIAQIPGSFIMERLRRRKPVWATLAILHRALWLVPAWLAWRLPHSPHTIQLILAAVILSTIIECLAAPGWHSWMADLVPEQMRGQFWGTRQAVVTITFLVAIGIAGVALDAFPRGTDGSLVGFAIVVAAGAFFGVADIVVHLGVPEPPRRPPLPGRAWHERLISPLRHPSFRNLAISMGVWLFACTMSGTFNAIYLKRVFHVSYTGLSALTICGSLSTVLASVFAGYLIDRIGPRAFAAVLMCIAPLLGASWLFVTDAPLRFWLPGFGELQTSQALALVCAATFVAGGFYSSVGICHLSLLGALAPKRERSMAMAVHWTLVGLVGTAGPLVGGYVVDWFHQHPSPITLFGGTRFDFAQMLNILHAVIIWTIAVPFMMRVRARREPLNISEAFERVIMVNPLRFASGVYHARVLASPSRRLRRRRAAEALGEAGAEIAVADLAARLDDPAADVREASALALGRIGGGAASAILLRKLDDSGSDIALAVLRAFRSSPDPRFAPRLVPLLRHPDTEIVRAAALTLGTLGNPVAVSPLVDLIHRTRHDALVAAAAEALGRLGDISAVYVILPRLRCGGTPFIRRALAVACGDLLGRPDGFYRLLMHEEHACGVAVQRHLRLARKTLRHHRRRLGRDAHARLVRTIQELERDYEKGNLAACAHAAYALAGLLGAAKFGVACTGDARAFLTELDRHDPRFTVGAWYLAILDGAFAQLNPSASLAPARDLLEIRLAIHLIASWIAELGAPPRPPQQGVLSLTGAGVGEAPKPAAAP